MVSGAVSPVEAADLIGPYELLMSKNDKLCKDMLRLYNQDMDAYGAIRYGSHEMFARIRWERVDLNEKEYPTYGCTLVTQSRFDINNDGINDLVVKYSGCPRGELTGSLFVFPETSDVLSKLNSGPGGLAKLNEAPIKFDYQLYTLREIPISTEERTRLRTRAWLSELADDFDTKPSIWGVFVLEPFTSDGMTYISATDFQQKWIVIAQFQKAELHDVCYLHTDNDPTTNFGRER